MVALDMTASGKEWTVVGGSSEAGLIVRTKKGLASPELPERLQRGAVVKATFHDSESGRLRYQLINGTGPQSGWISTRIAGKEVVIKNGEGAEDNAEQTKPKKVVKRAPLQPLHPLQELPSTAAASPVIPRAYAALRRGQYSARACPPARGSLYALTRPGQARRVPCMPRVPVRQPQAEARTAMDSDGEEVHLCRHCYLPLGDFGYAAGGTQGYLHGECKALLMLGEAREDEAARGRRDAALKQREREKYNIGWKAESVPHNGWALRRLGSKLAFNQGMCCLVQDGASSIQVMPTCDPKASVNLEYLSLALRVRMQEGREPLFSLDMKDVPQGASTEPQDLWQVKRFEPPWLGGTSVGEVMFQADYHLKELSMGESPQPVVGMRSAFDSAETEWHEKDWRAREWFVVNAAEIHLSKGNVLVPHVQMGVEAREQIQGPDGVEDALITRPDHPLVKYAEAFTSNFNLIAERKGCVYHLRELAKASVLAKYLLDSKVDLDRSWLELVQELKELYRVEIPQLWNQRSFSQVQVRDGKIMVTELGMEVAMRGVYGGIEFGLDKFPTGATTMQPGAGEAPYSLLFSAADRGAVMARGVVTPPSLMEPRGVDLSLDKFALSEPMQAVPEDFKLPAACTNTGKAFWASIEAGSADKDEDTHFFRCLFNPNLCDRREEGSFFVPPDARRGHMEELHRLVAEEGRVQQDRREHFLGKDFIAGGASPLFPSSWATTFGADALAAGELQPAQPEQQVVEQILKSTATFDKTTEDGTRFRVYKLGSLEVRTTEEHASAEAVGAAYLCSTPEQDNATGLKCDAAEMVVKVTEYVEAVAGKETKAPKSHFYAVFETQAGNLIVTEQLEDGTVTWVENPKDLKARNAAAKVVGLAEPCGLAVSGLRRYYEEKAPGAAASASKSECKRYSHGAFELALARP